MKAFTFVALFLLGLLAVSEAKVWHAILVFNGQQAKTLSTSNGAGNVFYETSTQELTLHITHSLGSRLTNAHIHSLPAGQTTGPVILPFYDRPKATKGTIVGSGKPIPNSALYYRNQIPWSVACALINGQSYFNLHTAKFPAGEIRADVPAVNANCTEWLGTEGAPIQPDIVPAKQVLNLNFAGMFDLGSFEAVPEAAAATVTPTTPAAGPVPPNYGLPSFTVPDTRPPSPFDQQPPISNPVIPPGRPGDNCYPNC